MAFYSSENSKEQNIIILRKKNLCFHIKYFHQSSEQSDQVSKEKMINPILQMKKLSSVRTLLFTKHSLCNKPFAR